MATLVWFRNDLRLKDNPALQAAAAAGLVVPVFVLDPRLFTTTPFGSPKTGAYRAQFLVEALTDLRQQLHGLGSDLLIARGKPEVVLPEIALQFACTAVHYSQEVCTEEVTVEARLAERLAEHGISLQSFVSKTLYHPDDLPFPVTSLPEVFTDFRKAVESYALIRPPLDAPTTLHSPSLPQSPLPTWDELGLQPPTPDARAVLKFQGGETAAWQRLQQYCWEADLLKQYETTRNGMLGADYSTKLSPWLALGCISPRSIYAEVKRYERTRARNKSTYWLVFELLWRDYFQFIALKHGGQLFRPGGLQRLDNYPWQHDRTLFEAWQTGTTGYPLIDANMRELALTGFMSNRGRQITASFLTKNLGIDWRWGADHFESHLVDYDPASNYGNWNYVAGVGNDARGFRYFHPFNQGEKYDPEAAYIKHWLPELAAVPAPKLLRFWELTHEESASYGIELGETYPAPVIDFQRSLAANEAAYRQAVPDRRQRLGNYKIKRAGKTGGNNSA